MDANGLRFWMLANAEDWHIDADAPPLTYDAALRCLRLASRRAAVSVPNDLAADRTAAEQRLALVPQVRDRYGTSAAWDATSRTVLATGAVPGTIAIYSPSPSVAPTGMALGADGVLYVALSGAGDAPDPALAAVAMLDLRGRWQSVTVQLAGFSPWRLAADPRGGAWVLDAAGSRLARLTGYPLPDGLVGDAAPDAFRPCAENPDPPTLTAWPVTFGADRPVALACHVETGEVAVLCWPADPAADALLVCFDGSSASPAPRRVTLTGAHHPYALAWLPAGRIALLVPALDAKEALVYPLTATATRVEPVGDFYPLHAHNGEPLAVAPDLQPHFVTGAGQSPLLPLSLAAFTAAGTATPTRLLDSGATATAWHRLYLEAVLPAHCGVRVLLAATDAPVPPADGDPAWAEHRFGRRFAAAATQAGPATGIETSTETGPVTSPVTGPVTGMRLPLGAWTPQPSEVPFHPGFLPCAPRRDEAGLFTALIQHTNRRTSTLRGRYLHVRAVLQGDGRTTPEVYALRAYGSRFSYVERYLPALYHESLFGPEATLPPSPAAPRSRADFLERFVDLFEGVLTPLEDRIAAAWLLTDPAGTGDDALAWLGAWIGVGFLPGLDADRRRALLQHAPELFRRRGTLAGLRLALDVVTGGAVSGGELVVVEDWRLRRTFATILGADLADAGGDAGDPLLAGLVVSGNSFVGDSLFLADSSAEQRKEFLSLFAADTLTGGEQQTVRAFFDRLAFRATVLVHQEVAPQELGLIRRVVELEKPAHIDVQVLAASQEFRVGLAALVGVDSYLAPEPPLAPVRIDATQLGVRDRILRPASLDPRLEAGRGPAQTGDVRPNAQLRHPDAVALGQSFRLDARRSQAAPGRTLAEYIWTRKS